MRDAAVPRSSLGFAAAQGRQPHRRRRDRRETGPESSSWTDWFETAVGRFDLEHPKEELTLPQRLIVRACAEPDAVAYRQKRHGYYQEWAWRRLALDVAGMESALRGLGVRRGTRAALIGDPCLELVVIELAVLALGGIAVALYPSHPPAELAALLRDCDPAIIAVDTQEQRDKLLDLPAGVSAARPIILVNGREQLPSPEANTLDYEHLRQTGAQSYAANPGAFLENVRRGDADDPALILYTGFSSGQPTGTVHSHRTYHHALRAMPILCPALLKRRLRGVAALPMAHAVGRITVFLPLASRLIVHFPEGAESLRTVFREVAPSFAFYVPRIFQKMTSALLSDLRSTHGLKRIAYRSAMYIADRAHGRTRGIATQWAVRLGYRVAQALVFRPLLKKAGLAQLGYAAAGGAPVPQELVSLLWRWGLDLREIYLQAECGVVLARQVPPSAADSIGALSRIGTIAAEISESGELLVQTPGLAIGRWEDGQVSRRTGGAGYRTGDIASEAQGRFRLLGNAAQFVALHDGLKINRQRIASTLTGSSYISEAIVLVRESGAVLSLIELDFEAISGLARDRNITYTSYGNLVQNREIVRLVSGEVQALNQCLEAPERVQSFRIIPFELDPEQGTITCARRVVDSKINDAFRDLIAEMNHECARSASTIEEDEEERRGKPS